MPDFFSPAAFLLFIVVAGIVGYVTAAVANWGLKRSLYRLECDITDLQNSLLSEIKKRAGQESAKSRKTDQTLIEQISSAAVQPKKSNEPWWMNLVHEDLKGN